MNKRNIIISAGGTGGHIFPALAVAKELSLNYNIIWVGGNKGLENQIVPGHGYRLARVSVGGIRNKGLMRKLLLPVVMIRALLQCLLIIIRYNPELIAGFGGYATFPVCLMGKLLAKPIVIHEQNSIAGLSNRIIARFADKVLTAFPGVLASAKTVVTGNPVRAEIIRLRDRPIPGSDARLKILVVGGSLGAKALNDTVPLAIARITDRIESVTHQVGRSGDKKSVQELYAQYKVPALVVNFIDNMAQAFHDADILICRSGASTVAEVAVVGIVAVFIPYPFAVDDHQTANARYLSDQQAAYLIDQKSLTPGLLAELLSGLTPALTRAMALKARSLGIADASKQICQQIEEQVKSRGS